MLNKDVCYLTASASLMLERMVVQYGLDKDLALELIVAFFPENEVWNMPEKEEAGDVGSA